VGGGQPQTQRGQLFGVRRNIKVCVWRAGKIEFGNWYPSSFKSGFPFVLYPVHRLTAYPHLSTPVASSTPCTWAVYKNRGIPRLITQKLSWDEIVYRPWYAFVVFPVPFPLPFPAVIEILCFSLSLFFFPCIAYGQLFCYSSVLSQIPQ